ncbi:MAG TPA: EAL domain-containing protein [Chromatiales bacterium]|nr:EAL domain-containing protein [Chromatiales bacterium]
MRTPDNNNNSNTALYEPRIIKALRRIGDISHNCTDLDSILHHSMQELLSIFSADRAWIIHPCDPEIEFFAVKSEATHPEWPREAEQGVPIRTDETIKQLLRSCLATDTPQLLDLVNCDDDNHSDLLKQFSVHTQICIALNPSQDQPWILGLHFCGSRRKLSALDIQLFTEVARRIESAISTIQIISSLNRSEDRYRLLVETMAQGVLVQNRAGKVLEINPTAQAILGLTATEIEATTIAGFWGAPIHKDGTLFTAEEHPTCKTLLTGTPSQGTLMGIFHCGEQRYRWIMLNTVPLQQGRSEPQQVISTFTDVTAIQEADESTRGDLHTLNAMERISSLTLNTDSIDTMLKNVLAEMLDIFDCDRAWLLYPCDPSAPVWHVPISQHRAEWPGLPAGIEIGMSKSHSQILRAALSSDSATSFNKEEHPDFDRDPVITEYNIQSQLIVPLFPRRDKPWLLGIHHCSQPVRYSDSEQKLFEAVGRRIADSLTTLVALRDLRESEARLKTFIEHAPEAIFVIDCDSGSFVDANHNAATLFRKTRSELLTSNFTSLSPEVQPSGCHSRPTVEALINDAINGGAPIFEWEFTTDNEERLLCEVHLIRLPSQEKRLIRASVTNITSRKQAESRMHKLSTALAQTADAVMITNKEGIIEYVNKSFEIITGYQQQDIIGKTPNILNSGNQTTSFYKTLWETITAGEVFSNVFLNQKKDGSLYYEEKSITPLHNSGGEITHFISTARDISGHMKIQEHLEFLAHHDVLTQLPNRIELIKALDQVIVNAEKNGSSLAVLFLDLDRFKVINETLGHDIGDSSLQQVSKLLIKCLREDDIIARFGGDEFAIVLNNIKDASEAGQTTQRILDSFSSPLMVDGHEVFLSASIGITVYPRDGDNSKSLLKNAGTAVYHAKEHGRNTFDFYHFKMSDTADNRLALETKLRRALENDEFHLLYQPLVNINNGQPIGAEALIRWQPEGSKPISPLDFIPILEETGLIVPVGEWIIDNACRQLSTWQQMGADDFRMSINLSTRQFHGNELEIALRHSIQKYHLNATNIDLEITEGLLLETNEETIALLDRISEMGFALSIDDFGTGYSSLSYLKRLPITTLKIDRTFVHDMQTVQDSTTLVEAIVSMAKSLRMGIIVEGVETAQQLALLSEMGCEVAQGYYFSKPIEVEDFSQLLVEKGIVEKSAK